MKIISIVIPTYNEGKNIYKLLNNILNQTLKPDEVIIVDNYSTDNTPKIIESFKDKFKKEGIILKFIQCKCNIAKARNIGINSAKGMIIVTMDAGVEYISNYIKEIVSPLLKYLKNNLNKININKNDFLTYLRKKNLSLEEIDKYPEAEFVQGVTLIKSKSLKEYFAGCILIKDPSEQKYVPSRASARCTAYFKYVWKKVGGYPETYLTGEDTKFNIEVYKHKFIWYCNTNAICYWEAPKTISSFIKKIINYAIGDAFQGNILYNKKLLLFFICGWLFILFFIYFLMINANIVIYFLLLTLILYIILGLYQFLKDKKVESLILFPLYLFLKYICYFVGLNIGLLKKVLKRN